MAIIVVDRYNKLLPPLMLLEKCLEDSYQTLRLNGNLIVSRGDRYTIIKPQRIFDKQKLFEPTDRGIFT